MDMDVYAEELINAYEHPKHKGKADKPTIDMHEENISCGDKITIHIAIENDKITDEKFEGTGCVISMGSADYLCDSLIGMSLEDLEKAGKDFVLNIIQLDPGPLRMHCATLSLRAAKKAVLEYEKKPIDVQTKEL